MSGKTRPRHREKLRARSLVEPPGSLTDDELLELLLTYCISRRDVRPLAKQLIEGFGGLSQVLAASHEALCEVDGLGPVSAVLIGLVDRLRHRRPEGGPEPRPAVPAPPAETLFDVAPPTPETEALPRPEAPRTRRAPAKPEPGPKPAPKPRPTPKPKPEEAAPPGRPPEPKVRLVGKALLKDAIQLLPGLPDTDSLDECRHYLHANLHYSSEVSRKRYANYIVNRMFRDGQADLALRLFARTHRGARDVQEACFYRFMKAEPLVQCVIEDLILPSVGGGRILRKSMIEYVAQRFPNAKSIKDCVQAVVEALSAGGLVKADRTKLTFTLRSIPIPAFAFVLHSEFPEPAMYDLSKVESGAVFRAMLWNPDQLLSALYELRNRELISKVSEIDTVRQFTTRHTLEEVVKLLAAGSTKR